MNSKQELSRRSFLASAPLAVASALESSVDEHSHSRIPEPDYQIPKSGFHGRDENKRVWEGDVRSGKVVFLAHCILNQNARIVDCAGFPAMYDLLLEYLQNENVGIIQMPCPEFYCLGLGRREVRVGLESPAGMERLQRLIDDLVFTVQEYLFQDFEVVGIIGKDGSPSCGVKRTWLDYKLQDGQGVFIRELKKRLVEEKLNVPVIGVADHKQQEAINWLSRKS